MPVFINEIVFRGRVEEAEKPKPEAERTRTDWVRDRDRIIADAVAEVLRQLDRQGSR
ncbi:DUF5908 family protein [Tropicimonas sp. TH_r6]|uniref:DUF5908 family protein n=1 Tax=Tropicimonas sp. TH_r6 TaxID=3082085 RepID=UPI002954DA41|nr:DUF5908 family protein [Tropicimonas sp. TH_r6]MDV7144033.1 DUF5908 family protein [Tropicimonas sp. TH_r6]